MLLFSLKLKCVSRKYIKHEGNNANAVTAKMSILGAFTGSLRSEVITTTVIREAPKARIFTENVEIALSIPEFYCIHLSILRSAHKLSRGDDCP